MVTIVELFCLVITCMLSSSTPTSAGLLQTTQSSSPTTPDPDPLYERESISASMLEEIKYEIANISTISRYGTKMLRYTRISVANLEITLPYAIVSKKLASSFSLVKKIGSKFARTSYKRCFRGTACMKAYIIQRSRESFTSCISSLSTSIEQQLISFAQQLRDVNVTSKAQAIVNRCMESKNWLICIDPGWSVYSNLFYSNKAYIGLLKQQWYNNTLSLSTCIGKAVNAADTLMEAYNTQIRNCISPSPFSDLINIPVILPTNESFYSNQIANSVLTEVENADATTNEIIQRNSTYVYGIASQEALSQKAFLDPFYVPITQDVIRAFKKAENLYSDSAISCVTKMKEDLNSSIDSGTINLSLCARGTGNINKQLYKILNQYNQLWVNKNQLRIQCLATNNLFITQGIETCVQDGGYKMADDFRKLGMNMLNLGWDLEKTYKSIFTCRYKEDKNVHKEIMRVKTDFEKCIYLLLNETYTINIYLA
uniref:Uncharacterized protein n=1 Tax=Clastoptera arizonana TaxID=38151 RepID=A0A1B6DV47_9HEMI